MLFIKNNINFCVVKIIAYIIVAIITILIIVLNDTIVQNIPRYGMNILNMSGHLKLVHKEQIWDQIRVLFLNIVALNSSAS